MKNIFKNYKIGHLTWLDFLKFLFLLAFYVLAYYFISSIDLTKITESNPILAPLLYILTHSLTIIVAPLGGELLFLSSGYLFGFWAGILYSIIAGLLGGFCNYYLARKYGLNIILKLIGHQNQQTFQTYSQKLGSQPTLYWLPLMSTGAYDLLCYVAGFVQMPIKKYSLLITLSGVINVPLYVAIGSGLVNGDWLTILIFVFAIPALSLIFRYFRQKTTLENKIADKSNS